MEIYNYEHLTKSQEKTVYAYALLPFVIDIFCAEMLYIKLNS